MSETPRRKRLQIHLSTAVVMMIAAGILIWANVTERVPNKFWWSRLLSPPSEYGWPFSAIRVNVYMDDGQFTHRSSNRLSLWALNACVGLAILVAIWFVCEWWIRRRAARKGT